MPRSRLRPKVTGSEEFSPARDIFRGPNRLVITPPQRVELEQEMPTPDLDTEIPPQVKQAADKISTLIGQFRQDTTNSVARNEDTTECAGE